MNKTVKQIDEPQVEVKPLSPKVVTLTELYGILMEEKGANIVSFVHTSNMDDKGKMVKKDRETKAPNPYLGDCFKTQQVNGMINFFYDDGVVRRLEKEGKSEEDFKKGESYHEPIFRTDGTLTPFARHKKDPRRIFLRLMLNNSTNVHYHTAKGHAIDTDAIKPFLKKRSEYKNQGLEKPLIFQVWKLEGIETITLNHQKYIIQN